MTLDLIQLQWQRIRTAERERETEIENVRLREQVKKLQNEVNDSKKTSTAKNAEMQHMFKSWQKFFLSTKAEVMKIKLLFIKEMNSTLIDKDILSSAFSKFLALYVSRDGDLKLLERKNIELMSDLEKLKTQKNDYSAEQKAFQKEMQNMKSKIQSLKEESNEKDNLMKNTQNNYSQLVERIDALKLDKEKIFIEKEKFQSKYEVEQIRTV